MARWRSCCSTRSTTWTGSWPWTARAASTHSPCGRSEKISTRTRSATALRNPGRSDPSQPRPPSRHHPITGPRFRSAARTLDCDTTGVPAASGLRSHPLNLIRLAPAKGVAYDRRHADVLRPPWHDHPTDAARRATRGAPPGAHPRRERARAADHPRQRPPPRAAAVPGGTVPIYQAVEAARSVEALTADDLLAMIEHQARQGVDYVTVHCGILREHVPLALGRVTGIVSRGGSLLAYWMMHHNRQ